MIDVTKCIGCRKGIGAFTKDKNGYNHLDFFATQEAASLSHCKNSDSIGEYVQENEAKGGVYVPNKELKEIFDFQYFWWESIMDLAYTVLKENKEIISFFEQDFEGKKLIECSNLDIEEMLIGEAEVNYYNVNEDEFCGLLKFSTKAH